MEGPIWVKKLGDIAPKIPAAQISSNQTNYIPRLFWDLIFISKKAMNTKVGDNFVAHTLDTKFALFGVRTWEIWCRQGRAANQKNLDEAEFRDESGSRKIPYRPTLYPV
jgi:hypothetical protein